MLLTSIILTVLCAAIAAVWVTRHFMLSHENRHGFVLTESYGQQQEGPGPSLCVVVAAKDEEANIGPCVQSLLSQDYPNFNLILCNDRSKDRTEEIVAGLAAGDQRMRVMNIQELPEGWCGKNNAMQCGIASTKSEYICMIDADCRQISHRTLSVAIQYARDNGADLLSILPVMEMPTFWESIIQPVCSGVMMIWFHPDSVNSPAKAQAYANGAFMLIKRSAYEQIGTHEAVKDRVNEDMHMAALVKRNGLRLLVVRGKGLYITRMYDGLNSTIRGWSRIFFGTFGTLGRLTASLAVLLILGVLPYLVTALGFTLWTHAATPSWTAGSYGAANWWLACGLAGTVACAIQLTAIYRFFKLLGAKASLAWSYPVGCLITIYVIILSLLKLRKGASIVWRNTSYAKPT
jgi:chlorobactene glucosyltransferase